MLKKIALIRAEFDNGAGVAGTALGAESMLQGRLQQQLEKLEVDCYWSDSLQVDNTTGRQVQQESNRGQQLKHLPSVLAICEKLSMLTAAVIAKGEFPMLLGGDHSLSIGSLAGVLQHYKRPAVLWVDAHGDLNTPESSPSGNIHGMSLATALGRGTPALLQLFNGNFLSPNQVAIIAARQLDEGERSWIRSSQIKCYTMHDIDQLGINTVLEQAIAAITPDTDGLHLSFDIDSVDPSEAPGTGTPVKGGLDYREAHYIMEWLASYGKVTSADLVEVNPLLDKGKQTTQLAVGLLCSLFGKRIL